jgi:hypothetical protein
MTTFSENIRKMMGWCPQKQNDLFQGQTKGLMHSTSLNLNPARESSGLPYEIRLPLDLPDWRELAIILILGFSGLILIFIDYLNRTTASYFGIITVNISFIIFFNLLDHNKVSINSEKLVIKKSFFKSIKIPRNNIKSIKIIENILYKYNWINLILIILILLVGFIQVLDLYREIMRSATMEDTVLRFEKACSFSLY